MNTKYESENKNIEYAIKIILDNYLRFKDLVIEGYEYPKEKDLMTFISSEFSKNSFDTIINEISSNDFKNKFHTKGSKRAGTFPPTTPFLAVVYSDSRKNLSVRKYLCIAYIFQSDLEGVYLTVSIGSEELKNGFDVKGFREEIKNRYRNKFNLELDSSIFNSDNFDLHCTSEINDKEGYDCSYAKDFEKGMVFNKFYAKDSSDLINDNLINDLEHYIRLYEFIINYINFDGYCEGRMLNMESNVVYKGFEETNILKDFKEIFERYPEESKNPFSENKFAKRMNQVFTNDLNGLVQEFLYDDKNYFVNLNVGEEQWLDIPWAGIRNNNVTPSFQEGFNIMYYFNFESNKCSLTLTQGDNLFSDEKRVDIANYLNEKLEESDFEITRNFVNDDKKYSEVAVLSKDYSRDTFESITLDDFKNDLFYLIRIYEYLIPYYEEYVNQLPLEEKKRVWVMPVIEKDDWNSFKNDSFIGINFDFIKNYSMLSKCDNVSDIKELIKDQISESSDIPNTLWKFIKEMKHEDIVVVRKELDKLAGIGVITSDVDFDSNNRFNFSRNVDWIFTPDDLKIGDNFFSSSSLDGLNKNPYLWNALISSISRTDKKLRENLISFLLNDFFNDYFYSDRGMNQFKKYNDDFLLVNKIWDDIIDKVEKGEPIEKDIWSLLNVEIEVQDYENDIRNNLIKYINEYDENNIDQVAISFFRTINGLLHSEDINKQKDILYQYSQDIFSKGIRVNKLSKILNYLDDSFYMIDKKVENTFSVLDLMFNDKGELDDKLNHYIDNNIRYEELMNNFEYLFDCPNMNITDKIFDMFIHWMTEEDLGHFAPSNLMQDNVNNFDIGILEYIELKKDYPELNLTYDSLNPEFADFIINEDIKKHILAALNSGNHIILDGTPGTGKTEISLKFAKVAEENNFIDGSIITTATSDWSTFDTIGGLMPKENGTLEFHPGKFLQAIESNKWLIIDEINRADIDKSFGQLFTVLSGQNVELPYKIGDKSIEIKNSDKTYSEYDENNATYYIGKNWRIIGTMNIDDKDSLFDLSYAFMRRFMFIEVDLPEKEEFINLITSWAGDLDAFYKNKLIELVDIIDFRKLGPAIFKDMIAFIDARNNVDNSNKNKILIESISSYILPQLEGLDDENLENIKNIISRFDESKSIVEKIDELKQPDF